jgi:Icc-related predicted phosphoesterase
MRLLLVSDLHYGLRQYDWVAESAPDFDVVVIAGDMLDLRSVVPIPAQTVAIAAQLARIGARGTLAAASGNHDLDDRDDAGEKAAVWLQGSRSTQVHVDGDSLVVGSTLLTICPWWDGPTGRKELEDRLVTESQLDKETWAWVYHAPPAGSRLSWDGRREYGDDVLSGWIERFEPDFVFAGHIHQSPFMPDGGWAERVGSTWVFNPGRQPGPVPAHIVLDLEAGQATWSSIEGRETIELDADTTLAG